MSETTQQETVQEPSVVSSTSIINNVVESVMDLIDDLSLFSTISRGALGTGNGICCQVGPSSPDEIYMDKNRYISLDLTINGKHTDLQTLSDAMNRIHESLPMLTTYPNGNGWQIVDITTITFPQQIGREDNNAWVMASSLDIKFATYTRNGYTPPTPETPEAEPAEGTDQE